VSKLISPKSKTISAVVSYEVRTSGAVPGMVSNSRGPSVVVVVATVVVVVGGAVVVVGAMVVVVGATVVDSSTAAGAQAERTRAANATDQGRDALTEARFSWRREGLLSNRSMPSS
jgi:hypothetical protein